MNEQQWDQYMHNTLRSDEHHKLPHIVRQRVDETLASLSELPMKGLANKHNRLSKLVSSIACVLIVITFSFSYLSPAVAKYLSQLPVIGSAFEWAGDEGMKSSVKNNLIDAIGQSVEDQGITITLDQVMFDGTRLVFGLIHEEGLILDVRYPNQWVKVNGNDLNAGISGGSKQIPGGLMATVYHYMPVSPLPDEFELTYIIDEVQRVNNNLSERVRGKWQFSTHVSKITEGVITRSFNPPLTKSYEGTTISITEVTSTPITTEVIFDMIKAEKFEQGNTIRIEEPANYVHNALEFALMSEQGLYLEPLSSQGSWDIQTGPAAHYSALFAPLTSPSKLITFQTVESSHPLRKVDDSYEGEFDYVSTFEPKVNYMELSNAFPLTLQQGAAGHITFHSIEHTSEQTIVDFEVIGNDPNNQMSVWWIENEQGERYTFDRYDQIRISEQKYAFRAMLPPMDLSNKLKIATTEVKAPHVLKELEFQIPLD
jgi:hypothetical protein